MDEVDIPVNPFVPIPDNVCAGYEMSLVLACRVILPQEYSPKNGAVVIPDIPEGRLVTFENTLKIVVFTPTTLLVCSSVDLTTYTLSAKELPTPTTVELSVPRDVVADPTLEFLTIK